MAGNLFSRRDFLKLSSATLLGLLLTELTPRSAGAFRLPQKGRVLATSLVVRDAPRFSGRKVRSVKRDDLLDLVDEVCGGVETDYNRTWYQLSDGHFVYSGWVQPLDIRSNPEVTDIPASGLLGEITLPFIESIYGINLSPSPGPRLYYASTHWIESAVIDKRDGSLWYQAFDAATQSHYYIKPVGVRLIPLEELVPLSPDMPADEKHIEIHLSRQLLLAYEGDRPVLATRVATGRRGYESPSGTFTTFHKRPTFHMFGGADEFSIFDLPGVPWDSYVTESGVALHGTYWHNDFGAPHSHGCINVAPEAAQWIFRWTLPAVPPDQNLILMPGSGTQVKITKD